MVAVVHIGGQCVVARNKMGLLLMSGSGSVLAMRWVCVCVVVLCLVGGVNSQVRY
jgi:hypothetical protein